MNRSRCRAGLVLIVAVGLFFSCVSCSPQSQLDRKYVGSGVVEDGDIFYESLAPYGRWVNHQTYGQVWYPLDVPMGWRPYTDGHWEYSREYGWVWESDRAWGWAPFHYGRWAFDDWYGWVWVPGREWAPAWVVWRYGGGYAAWAPMPPTALWRSGRGLERRYFRPDRDLAWDSWVGVPDRHLHGREMRRHMIGLRETVRVVEQTTTVVYVTEVNGRIINQGVPVGYLERVNARPIPRVRLYEVDRPSARDGQRDRGGLKVVRPHFPPQSPADIRRDVERAQAVALQQELDETKGDEASPDQRYEPRKAGRFDEKSVTPAKIPPEESNDVQLPPSPAAKIRAPRGTGEGSRDSTPAQTIVPESKESLSPDSPFSGGVPEMKRRKTPPPVMDQKEPGKQVLEHDTPQPEKQDQVEETTQQPDEPSGLPIIVPVEAPVLPVVTPPHTPAPPDVPNVPVPDFDSDTKRGPDRVRRPETDTSQIVPEKEQEQAVPASVQEIVVPVSMEDGPVRDDQPSAVNESRVQDGLQEQNHGEGNLGVERAAPHEQVEQPVAPSQPDAPVVPPPHVPAPPEMPQSPPPDDRAIPMAAPEVVQEQSQTRQQVEEQPKSEEEEGLPQPQP